MEPPSDVAPQNLRKMRWPESDDDIHGPLYLLQK